MMLIKCIIFIQIQYNPRQEIMKMKSQLILFVSLVISLSGLAQSNYTSSNIAYVNKMVANFNKGTVVSAWIDSDYGAAYYIFYKRGDSYYYEWGSCGKPSHGTAKGTVRKTQTKTSTGETQVIYRDIASSNGDYFLWKSGEPNKLQSCDSEGFISALYRVNIK